MREIKFRAKTINTGNWVESITIAKGTIKRKRDDYFFELDENRWVGVDAKTIGQFTGLMDKNGKEIYEGDFCIVPYLGDEKTRGVIEYKNGAFVFMSKENPSLQVVGWSMIKPSETEVVGNIFETPELLNF